jgi:hypothetical protein
MRYLSAVWLLAAGAPWCLADVIIDPFHAPQVGCNLSITTPFSLCDVIGDRALYDIEKVDASIYPISVALTLYFNYGGGITLQPYDDGGGVLGVGDVLFYDPSEPKTLHYNSKKAYPKYRFGVALHDHDGLIAGNLYKIPDPDSLQTAFGILASNQFYYRRTEPVWMPASAQLAAPGKGVSVVTNGNGITSAQFAATIGFIPTLEFLALASLGEIGIAFASAACANDVLAGTALVRLPEPGTLLTIAAGIALLAARARRFAVKS